MVYVKQHTHWSCEYPKKTLTLRKTLINYKMTTKTERQRLNRIKAVLAETNHTGKWLATEMGKDPVTVSKWCSNVSQPDLSTLYRIASVLKVDVTDLLTRPKL